MFKFFSYARATRDYYLWIVICIIYSAMLLSCLIIISVDVMYLQQLETGIEKVVNLLIHLLLCCDIILLLYYYCIS